MIERPDPLPKEIIETELFINDLLNDIKHPVHNRLHPMHQVSINALQEMIQKLDVMRIEWLSRE